MTITEFKTKLEQPMTFAKFKQLASSVDEPFTGYLSDNENNSNEMYLTFSYDTNTLNVKDAGDFYSYFDDNAVIVIEHYKGVPDNEIYIQIEENYLDSFDD